MLITSVSKNTNKTKKISVLGTKALMWWDIKYCKFIFFYSIPENLITRCVTRYDDS